MKISIKTYYATILLLLGSFPIAAQAADWNPLPDTGQTTCYDAAGAVIDPCPAPGNAFHGQDANYSDPALAYTDNGDGTVTDVNTGLMWQQTYNATRTWQAAIDYCNGLTFPAEGYDDWYLPERFELRSIADYGRLGPAINQVFSCQSSDYWSATTYASSTSYAWNLNFYNGDGGANSKTYYCYVRCVRAGL